MNPIKTTCDRNQSGSLRNYSAALALPWAAALWVCCCKGRRDWVKDAGLVTEYECVLSRQRNKEEREERLWRKSVDLQIPLDGHILVLAVQAASWIPKWKWKISHVTIHLHLHQVIFRLEQHAWNLGDNWREQTTMAGRVTLLLLHNLT